MTNNNNKYRVILLMFFLLTNAGLFAQQKNNNLPDDKIQVGAEVLWYPAGWITGPSVNYFVAPKHVVHAGLGVNIANRHDWGLNDDEKGTGFGGSLGYRYLFTPQKNSFFLAARVDFWAMKIKWKDKTGTPQAINGTTKITVFQPTAHFGYWIKSTNCRWNLLFSAGGGAEINIKTNGKKVGEGGMWLLGVSVYYSL
ncbi:MAG: hypothetical protein WBP16_11150 [Ferruginibacter sp.]